MRSKLPAHLGRELQRDSGLSEADYAIMVELSEAPEERLRLHELGARLHWEKSRLSKQVSRMSARGLVRREDCPTDGRGAFAVLMPVGREAIEAAAPRHAEQVRRWFVDALSPEQLEAMAAIAAAVTGRLPEHDPGDRASGAT
jgi:DNA-binding MarR family transcriptional regulator